MSGTLKIVLLAVGILVGILLIVGLVLFLRARKKRKQQAAAKDAPPPPPPRPARSPEEQKALHLRRSRLSALFSAELRRLRKNTTGRDSRYQVPWCLSMGPRACGQTTVLRSTRLHSPFSSEDEVLSQQAGLKWWYYDKGLALDLDGLTLEDDETFHVLLRLLRQHRPKRPLDSILLPIPATDLIGPHALTQEEAQRRAEHLYLRLHELQKALLIRVPIYILITKCDAVPGFSSLVGALSPALRDQLFGWSSPHEPEVPYATTWVNEIFDSLYRTGCQTQLEILARGEGSAPERDAVFLFPRNMQKMAEPLRVMLDGVFKTTVYQEPCLLRGVYFCGDPTQDPTRPKENEAARPPSFLRDLFAAKIFPEQGLATPLSFGLAQTEQAVTFAKWFLISSAVFGVAMLSHSYYGLVRDTGSVLEFLDQIPTGRGDNDRLGTEEFSKRTQTVLGAMGNVSTNTLRRVRMPTSWFSSIDDAVRDLMRDSFETVILQGLRYGLISKAKQDLGVDAEAAGEDDDRDDEKVAPPVRNEKEPPKIVALQNLPEFRELRAFAEAYALFSENVERYNGMGSDRRGRLQKVATLVKYAFGTDLGDSFTKKAELYNQALADAAYPPFDMSPVRKKVRKRARGLSRAVQRALFQYNPIDVQVEDIQRSLVRLRAEGQQGGTDMESLVTLRDTIVRVQDDIERVEVAWLAKELLDLDKPYRELLSLLHPITGPTGPLNEQFDAECKESFRLLKKRLLERQVDSLGALVLRDNEKGKLNLAPEVIKIKQALDSFLSQNYVQPVSEQTLASETGEFRVNWNDVILRQSLQLSESYTAFLRDRAPQVHEVLRERLKKTALNQLDQHMPALVRQARRIERVAKAADPRAGLEDLSIEVGDMRRATPPLRQVLDSYEQLGLQSAHSELYRTLEEDARRLLRRLDALVERDDIYKISARLREWRGTRPPALDTFDMEDADSLAQFIKAQRARIKTWARDYARVPISLLEGITKAGVGGNEALLTKWQGIVTDLDQFEKITPNNTVKELESFVEATLMAITPETCLDKLGAKLKEDPDYFMQVKVRIHNAVRTRCVQLSEERVLAGAERLIRRFKKDLEGRFPFTRYVGTLEEAEAEPQAVRAFMQEFDDYDTRFTAYRNRGEPPLAQAMYDASDKIESFLKRVRAVRPFFTPLVSDKGGDLPRYTLGVEFRVNQKREKNGDQIAEYTFEVGDTRIDGGTVAWQVGDKLRVNFRWAKDGPFKPSNTGQPKHATVDKGEAVGIDWAGNWALLRFLRYYPSQRSDFVNSLDVLRPHVLKFVMAMEDRKKNTRIRLLPEQYYAKKGEAPQPVRTGRDNVALIFVRVSVTLPEAKEPIEVPNDWPAVAPSLRGNVEQ